MNDKQKAYLSKIFKGRKISAQGIENMRKSKIGKPKSEEFKQKLRDYYKTHDGYWKGKHLSDKTKKLISLNNKSSRPDVIAKRIASRGNFKTSVETKLKLAESTRKAWKNIDYRNKIWMTHLWHGPLHSRVTTEQRKQATLTRIKNGTMNKPGLHSQKTKDYLRELRLKQVFPKEDSDIERMLQISLTLEGIKFQTHKPIKGQPDIFIEPNLCIFVDGCYFHGCKECHPEHWKDKIPTKNIEYSFKVDHELSNQGYHVMRIWGHEIERNIDEVRKNIIDLIKDVYYSRHQPKLGGI